MAAAFLPRPRKDLEPSVYRIKSMSEQEAFTLGKRNIPKAHRIFGYGEIRVEDVSLASPDLSVRPDEPPPRHALIVGWPTDSNEVLQKARHLQIAEDLAIRATLHLAAQD